MVERAPRDFGVTPDRAFVIGDSATDAAAGKTGGCRTILIGADGPCDYHAADFADAARWIGVNA